MSSLLNKITSSRFKGKKQPPSPHSQRSDPPSSGAPAAAIAPQEDVGANAGQPPHINSSEQTQDQGMPEAQDPYDKATKQALENLKNFRSKRLQIIITKSNFNYNLANKLKGSKDLIYQEILDRIIKETIEIIQSAQSLKPSLGNEGGSINKKIGELEANVDRHQYYLKEIQDNKHTTDTEQASTAEKSLDQDLFWPGQMSSRTSMPSVALGSFKAHQDHQKSLRSTPSSSEAREISPIPNQEPYKLEELQKVKNIKNEIFKYSEYFEGIVDFLKDIDKTDKEKQYTVDRCKHFLVLSDNVLESLNEELSRFKQQIQQSMPKNIDNIREKYAKSIEEHLARISGLCQNIEEACTKHLGLTRN